MYRQTGDNNLLWGNLVLREVAMGGGGRPPPPISHLPEDD